MAHSKEQVMAVLMLALLKLKSVQILSVLFCRILIWQR
jgi:hypothetical protein